MSASKKAKISYGDGGGGGGGGGAAVTPISVELSKWAKEEIYYTATADMHLNGAPLGSADLVRVKRGAGAPHFHEACDAHSSDLQEVGVTLFDGRGNPRAQLAKTYVDDAEGDFLYIRDLRLGGVDEDLAPRAIKALLLAVRGWALAAFFVSAPLEESDSVPRTREWAGKEATAAEKAAVAAANARLEKLRGTYRLHTLRAGLSQVAKGSIYIATRAHAKRAPLTRAEALTVPEREAKVRALSAADNALFEHVLKILSRGNLDLGAEELARVRELIAAGASVASANVLHACAAKGAIPAFTRLLSLLPAGGALQTVNVGDFSGTTPLMLAASRARGMVSIHNPRVSVEFCALLLSLGADKNAVNDEGLTAFGALMQASRRYRDFAETFGSACFAARNLRTRAPPALTGAARANPPVQ